jgi:PD-(D/E)XK nuclease superfamily
MTLPRLSASKLVLYESCPTSYKARYIEKLRNESLNVYALSGSAVHKAIQNYYLTGADMIRTYLEQFNKSLTDEVEYVERNATVQRQALDMLTRLDLTAYKPKKVAGELQLEKHFKVPYPVIDPICTLEGYIDFVGSKDYVVDWKTGKETYTSIEDHLQFIVYAYAFKQLYKKSLKKALVYKLKDGTVIEGSTFNFNKLDTTIRTFLADPMIYELEICGTKCPFYCGVRHAVNKISDS